MNRIPDMDSFQDVEEILRPFKPLVKQLTGKDTVLDRILPLMDYLGNPQNKLRTIHIAGTSGKTSTSYYIASLLNQLDIKIGLTVSPHIDKLSERAQLNGSPLPDKVFFKELKVFLELLKKSGISPSYFELIYAFSIWLFAKYDVDYAVIETGLGGLQDATNVVSREDKVCVITDIGYDHMSILGNSLEEITAQKVGIVHKNNPLLMYQQSKEVMEVIDGWVSKHQAKLYLTTEAGQKEHYGRGQAFKNLPDYQKRNWLLAYYVYRFIAKRDKLRALTEAERALSQQIVIPARMDEVKVNGKLLIMDGAHNYQKMSAFISSFRHKYGDIKPELLVGFRTGKDYVRVAPLLKDFASKVIVTNFETSQDLPIESENPKLVAEALHQAGVNKVIVEPDRGVAYQALLNSGSEILIITGSFYLIGQLREKDIQVD